MSEFSSIPIFGRSLVITSDNPARTRMSVAMGTALLVMALFVLLYPDIDEINRMTIFPLLMGGFAISTTFIGKNRFQRNRLSNSNWGYIGSIYLLNFFIMAIVLVVVFGKLL